MTYLIIMSGHSFVRDAIVNFLSAEGDRCDVMALECPEQMSALDEGQRSDVKVVILYIGDLDARNHSVQCDVDAVRRTLGATPLVLLGNREDPCQIAAALRTGANGYIPSVVTAEVIKHALPLVAGGGVFAPPYLYGFTQAGSGVDLHDAQAESGEPQPELNGFTQHQELNGFTQREMEVLKLLGAGLPNKLIAHRMTLKEGTVKVHMRNLMKKLKVQSRTQAALIASRHFSLEGHDDQRTT